MNQVKRIAAIVAALALTFGLAAGRVSASPTDATLEAGSGAQCGITVLPADSISFGTFTFNSALNQYVPALPGVSNFPIFALQLSSQAPLGACTISASGTDLTLDVDNAIPVNRVSLAQGVAAGALLTQITSLLGLGANAISIPGAITLSGTPQTLTSGVVLLGTGIVVVQGGLVLQAADHSLAPGSYTGTVTFTGSTTTP